MDSSLEEISESLHGFCRKFVAADARSLTLIKTKSYWLAKINKLQQTRGRELQNPLGFLIIKGTSNFNFKFVISYFLIS